MGVSVCVCVWAVPRSVYTPAGAMMSTWSCMRPFIFVCAGFFMSYWDRFKAEAAISVIYPPHTFLPLSTCHFSESLPTKQSRAAKNWTSDMQTSLNKAHPTPPWERDTLTYKISCRSNQSPLCLVLVIKERHRHTHAGIHTHHHQSSSVFIRQNELCGAHWHSKSIFTKKKSVQSECTLEE